MCTLFNGLIMNWADGGGGGGGGGMHIWKRQSEVFRPAKLSRCYARGNLN